MRQKIVAGNWKMNLDLHEGIDLVKQLADKLKQQPHSCRVILAPPYIHLASVSESLAGSAIELGAQNMSEHEKGAYTGEVSADMLCSCGVKYILIGHSERRAYFAEDSALLAKKVRMALAKGLTPIFCVGEQLADREAGRHLEIVARQVTEGLFGLSEEEFSKVIVAYEPVWAIGTGRTASPEDAQEMHAHLRQAVAKQYSSTTADNLSILYGGSCNAENAKALFAQPDIDGGLIGGAALSVEKFMPIIEARG